MIIMIIMIFLFISFIKDWLKVEEFNWKRDIFQLPKFVKKHLTENSGQKEVKDEL